jgi:cell wall-associated NlpC family hydrolase
MTGTNTTTVIRWIVRGALAALAMGALAGTASASWSDNNCHGGSSDIATWKRSQAKDYAQRAVNEGYEWGGGCFKLNDEDDTPNQPDSGGEGTDCSGFVFKTWALRADGKVDFRQWDHQKEIHGPYSTASFFSPAASNPFKSIAKGYASTGSMDAFV